MANLNVKAVIIRVLCKNDKNGNPRRGWLVIDRFRTVFVDEEYCGESALTEYLGGEKGYELTGTRGGPTINVAPAEYNRYKREYAFTKGLPKLSQVLDAADGN